VLQPYAARKGELVGTRVKTGDRDEVAENIVHPPDLLRLGDNAQALIEQFLVIAITWAKHHPMVAKSDWYAIAINRDVPNCQNRHLIECPRENLPLVKCRENWI
jgi:hypothetical protein